MVTIEGMDSFIKSLDNLIDVNDVVEACEELATIIENDAKAFCPVDTGELVESIRHDVSVDGDEIIGEISTDCKHAAFVEFGTGVVGGASDADTARRASQVGWQYDVNHHGPDGWVYPTKDGGFAHTAGQAPQPYMYPAMLNNEDLIVEKLKGTVAMSVKWGKK